MKTYGLSLTKSYRIFAFSILAIGLTMVASDPAQAGGGSWGSSSGGFGSSGGSWGSRGGSSGGSYGSSGGYTFRTPIRTAPSRMHARHWSRRHGSTGGSSGGSSGGSRGTWASTGSLGSSGSWSGSTGSFGSSGGYNGSYVGSSLNSYYPLPATNNAPISDGGSINSMLEGGGTSPTPAPVAPGADTVPKIERPGPDPTNDATSTRQPGSRTAVLNLVLPEETKIFINDRLTKTTGSNRSYVSRNLGEDRDYKYQVKAVLVRDGQELVRTKLVKMRPGITETVNFDFDDPVLTTLALKVPADATVKICGKEMSTVGTVRSFTTSHLKDGEIWKDYKVTVEYQRDGKPHVEERSIDLLAGELRRMSIGVDAKNRDQVASK